MGFNKTTVAVLGLSALLAGFAGHKAGYAQSVSVAPSPKQESKSESSAAAAMPASTQSSVPTIKVTARETVVDVTVTDAKGKPVHGLTQADFTVKEDGKAILDVGAAASWSARVQPSILLRGLQPWSTTCGLWNSNLSPSESPWNVVRADVPWVSRYARDPLRKDFSFRKVASAV